MISYEDALALLEKYELHADIVSHSVGVAEVAHDLARRIAANAPDEVDPHKTRIAALLHDIGRCQGGAHEEHSERILRREGLDELADIIIHGAIYEAYRLRGRDDPALLPRTLEQKIVCYADLRFCQRPMTLRQRLDDALKRKGNNAQTVRTIHMAEPRLFALEREVLALAQATATCKP